MNVSVWGSDDANWFALGARLRSIPATPLVSSSYKSRICSGSGLPFVSGPNQIITTPTK